MTTTMWFTTVILLLLILLVVSALAIDSLGTATKSFDQHADEALQLFVVQPVEEPETIEEAARNLFLGGLITSEEYHRVVREDLN